MPLQLPSHLVVLSDTLRKTHKIKKGVGLLFILIILANLWKLCFMIQMVKSWSSVQWKSMTILKEGYRCTVVVNSNNLSRVLDRWRRLPQGWCNGGQWFIYSPLLFWSYSWTLIINIFLGVGKRDSLENQKFMLKRSGAGCYIWQMLARIPMASSSSSL